QRFGMGNDVRAVPAHAAFGRLGDGGQDAHERGLAGAVGPEEADHARIGGQRELPQGPEAPAVALRDVLDFQSHAALPAVRWTLVLRTGRAVGCGPSLAIEAGMSDYSLVALPFLASAALFMFRVIASTTADRKLATYSRVRRDILSRRIEPPTRVRCTVMDWRIDTETMTLVVHPDTSALIYALEQKGTVGDPEGHAQASARRFLRAVESKRPEMTATSDTREPPAGHACFWIVDQSATLTSGDVPLEDLKLRVSSWTGAWGRGMATVNDMFESYRIRRARLAARAGNVAAGPRSV